MAAVESGVDATVVADGRGTAAVCERSECKRSVAALVSVLVLEFAVAGSSSNDGAERGGATGDRASS